MPPKYLGFQRQHLSQTSGSILQLAVERIIIIVIKLSLVKNNDCILCMR